MKRKILMITDWLTCACTTPLIPEGQGVMDVFIRLIKDNDNIRLILVREYEKNLDPRKNETLVRIQNTPQLEAIGPKYNDDLLAYYAASNCFVLSYLEGFPNTVIEAGAMGLPSIIKISMALVKL